MNTPKTASEAITEFHFCSDTYTVSEHPDRDSALALQMRGQCMPIDVATIGFSDGTITFTRWETPFSGFPPEWQDALLAQVTDPESAVEERA